MDGVPITIVDAVSGGTAESYRDELRIKFANTEIIPKGTMLYVFVTPCRNPPSMKPITGFAMFTGDKDFF